MIRRHQLADTVRAQSETLADIFDVQVPEWYARGLCAQTDPEAFFPGKGGSVRSAKKICAGCPVATKCLEYAIANNERFGIWGGKSETERRQLAKAEDKVCRAGCGAVIMTRRVLCDPCRDARRAASKRRRPKSEVAR